MAIIKFIDLQNLHKERILEIKEAVNRVIDSGHYILGKEVNAFEDVLAKYIGTEKAIGVSCGLDALKIIFKAYLILGKLKPGDEVILPANTFIASLFSITESGLTPVLVEVNPITFNIDASEVEKMISPKTKAILLVHLYGRSAFNEELITLIQKHQLICIEDAAQAIGAKYLGKKIGSIGDAAAFSFFPSKNMGALGDGGAVSTSDQDLAAKIFALRNYGSSEKYVHQHVGMNAKLDEIQATVLNIKLKDVDEHNKKRRRIAMQYNARINNKLIQVPNWPTQELEHVWHLYVLRTRYREQLKEYLDQKEIQTIIHYPTAMHLQPAYPELSDLTFPIVEQLHNEVISIPLHPSLVEEEVDFIIDTLNRFQIKD
jgi:dTDP-4-amino-4,6-dideoxygalactose transaminase